MTDPVSITAEQLAQLTHQNWRRLGITQTFDRLLVEVVAVTPGTAEEIRDAVGQNLSGGAVKFWELSFPNLLKDLRRHNVVDTEDGVRLSDAFMERLQRLIGDQESGVSHVDPTPGVTLEAVLEHAKRREASAKAKTSRPTKTRAKAAPKTPSAPKAAPIKRAAPKPEVAPEPVIAPKPIVPQLAPVNKLFTSLKLNRLLDSLDGARLLKSQLAGRLDLGGANFERFLDVCNQLEITRSISDNLVELHWKGRELARTTSADRRMALIELVRELRSAAEPG